MCFAMFGIPIKSNMDRKSIERSKLKAILKNLMMARFLMTINYLIELSKKNSNLKIDR
jgi:hypothetical protein